MPTQNDLVGIMIRLLIGGDQALFILLGADGSINRMGTGEANIRERDLFIGKTDPALFNAVQRQITPKLLAWLGDRRSDPQPRGASCELTVGFQQADGTESAMIWCYGAESLGPPPEVREFVIAAVEATNPWFQEQKAMVARNSGRHPDS
jgi:hypothetical protein